MQIRMGFQRGVRGRGDPENGPKGGGTMATKPTSPCPGVWCCAREKEIVFVRHLHAASISLSTTTIDTEEARLVAVLGTSREVWV